MKRIAFVSHSAIHLRQQAFYRAVAARGFEVLVVCPTVWGDLRAPTIADEHCRVVPLVPSTPRMESFHLPARGVIRAFKPDWLYVQNEPFHAIAADCAAWARDSGAHLAVFTWENNEWIMTRDARGVLDQADLVICGNSEARMLVEPHTSAALALDLQVGVEPALFPFAPYTTPRKHDVLCVSRVGDPMKGTQVIPMLQFLRPDWDFVIPNAKTRVGYERMRAWYHSSRALLTPSIEVPWLPREQGPAYTNLEAMFCGTPVVTTETAAISEWLDGAPVTRVGLEVLQDPEHPVEIAPGPLVEALEPLLDEPLEAAQRAAEARLWVANRFSNEKVAERLVKHMEAALL